uniref:GPN-loop GTPase n=1 Tax=Pavo cristatus TaxID=9049 RepID=A0A8C9FV00_PAVCR
MAAAGGPAAVPPVCVLVLGMAGSGKTTFVQCLTAHLHGQRCPPYVINLDPAVHELPFPANIGEKGWAEGGSLTGEERGGVGDRLCRVRGNGAGPFCCERGKAVLMCCFPCTL